MEFTNKIEDKTAASAKRSTVAKNLQSDTASKQQQLDEATALRKVQLASLTQKEKELLGASLSLSLLRSRRDVFAMGCHGGLSFSGTLRVQRISGIKSAITVLQKHHTNFYANASPVEDGAARHASAWSHAPRREQGSPEASCVVVGADRISQGLQIRSPARGSAFSNRCSRRSKQHERFDGVEQENSSIDEQLRESWETREEWLNSKLNDEAATNEVHAQAKQDLADTEMRTSRTQEGLRVVPCSWARGVGNIASGIHSSRSSSSRGMLEASPGWASGSTAPMTRGAGDTRRKEQCLPAGIQKYKSETT